MKALSFISLLFAAAAVQAAPVITQDDISEDALKGIATERQKASLDDYNRAKQKAEQKREEAAKETKEITARNDDGLKKTIQKRHLNTMLPPCERELETPREPSNYQIRY